MHELTNDPVHLPQYKHRRDSEGDATQRIAQRDFADFRGAGTSVARVRWTARYARASARGSSFVQRRIPIAGAKGQRTASMVESL